MATFEESIDVKVPVRTAYDQWTQFESFPQFMEGVEEVRQISDTKLAWRAEIAGRTESWDAEITEQTPDQRIAWTSRSGAKNAGVVTFHHIDDHTTRVMLQLEYEPDSLLERAGAALGIVGSRIKGDLKRFKEFIEERGEATGAWRGEVEH
jgi:uncharacterized membrane protein